MKKSTVSRIDGRLDRSFPAQIRVLSRGDAADGAAPTGNVRLRLSFSSEAPVLRSSWFDEAWIEVLGHAEGECDLSRLNAGAAVLCNHDRRLQVGSPMAMVGATDRGWIEDARGHVELTMSRRDGLQGLLQDIDDDLVRNVSVGYRIIERKLVKTYGGKQPDEYRVTRWQPIEISLVDIPADAAVGIGRSAEDEPRYRVVDLPEPGEQQERSMDETTQPAAQAATPPSAQVVDLDQARAEGARAERERQSEIRRLVRAARLPADLAERMVTDGVSVDAAGRSIIEELARQDDAVQTRSANAPHIETLRDEEATRAEGITQSVLHRLGAVRELDDNGRQYRGMRLMEIGRDMLEARGVRTRGMASMDLAREILQYRSGGMGTVSDFSSLMANVANKRLRQAYDENPGTYTMWARRGPNAPDFKNIQLTQMSGAPDLLQVNEHGEFKTGKMYDGAETYAVVTYGRIVPLTRQAMINDDLRAFDRLVTAFGYSARRLENRTVYSQLTANAALSDSVALFHATHANLATGGGSALAFAALSTARAAMRVQKGQQSEELNVAPAYLIVPASLEQTAYQLTSPNYVPATKAEINEFRAGGRTALTPVVEPVLDANSATAWYLAASGNQIDTVEYCYLDGAEGAVIESEPGFVVDGVQYKCRLDFGAHVADYRGLYKGAGA